MKQEEQSLDDIFVSATLKRVKERIDLDGGWGATDQDFDPSTKALLENLKRTRESASFLRDADLPIHDFPLSFGHSERSKNREKA